MLTANATHHTGTTTRHTCTIDSGVPKTALHHTTSMGNEKSQGHHIWSAFGALPPARSCAPRRKNGAARIDPTNDRPMSRKVCARGPTGEEPNGSAESS